MARERVMVLVLCIMGAVAAWLVVCCAAGHSVWVRMPVVPASRGCYSVEIKQIAYSLSSNSRHRF